MNLRKIDNATMSGVSFCIRTILGTYQSDRVTIVIFVNGRQPSIITLRCFFSLQNHGHSFCLNQCYMHACCWRHAVVFSIFYCSGGLAMTHLSCPMIPLIYVSPPQHIPAIVLVCLALTGSQWQTWPWHKHMWSIGLISWMWMRYTIGSQGMIWWWILFQPLVIYRTVLKKSHTDLAPAIHMLPDSHVYDRYSFLRISITRH